MQKKVHVKTAKGRKVSSTHWLQRHINDPYVAMAKEEGYRSRAAFKLIEIHKKFKIIPSSNRLVAIDLGCAPGSWLQVLSKYKLQSIVGVDLKEVICSDIPNAIAITGDFTDPNTITTIKSKIENSPVGLIVSDMAPSSCGDPRTDHIRITMLAHQVLDFVTETAQVGSSAVIKVIQGNLSKELNERAKKLFSKVHWYKPKASYADSAEIYLVMLGLK